MENKKGRNIASLPCISVQTVHGSQHHSKDDQRLVDHAVKVLPSVFGDSIASPDEIRETLSDPSNVLLASENALAIVRGAGEEKQQGWLMWVDPAVRGNGIGGALLKHMIDEFTREHHIMFNCPAERKSFYQRYGFQEFCTASGGNYIHMAGPAESRDDVRQLYPKLLW